MKKIAALGAVLIAGSVYGQTATGGGLGAGGRSNVPMADRGSRHMFEFNTDSLLQAALSFDKVKTPGADSDNDVNYRLSGNYYYGIHRLIQVGVKFSFLNGVVNNIEQEQTTLRVGGYVNSNEDFSNAAFIGAFVGAGYSQTFGDVGGRDDLRTGEVSVGKRFSLDRWGIERVSWSPEVALVYTNSTTDNTLDYLQSLQFRILQFSVIF